MTSKSPNATPSQISIGWRVNRALDPEYWLRHSPKLGRQASTDLVELSAADVGHHTVVVAQSGSGKSFFLGRLIEEITLNTKARCLVLDPNGDFTQVDQVSDATSWAKAGYDPDKRTGFLPTETREAFLERWQSIAIQVRSQRTQDLRLPWSAVQPEFLNADLNPVLAEQVYNCHRFVQAVSELSLGKVIANNQPINLLEEAEDLLTSQAKNSAVDSKVQLAVLEREYNVAALTDQRVQARLEVLARKYRDLFTDRPQESLNTDFVGKVQRPVVEASINRAIDACLRLPRHISPDASSIYFGRARRFESVFSFAIGGDEDVDDSAIDARLDVVDLASIPESEVRRVAISSLLSIEFDRLRIAWDQAIAAESDQDDLRVPTFVVVDEAHNLMPAGEVDRSRAVLREQFRTIAAEGRKFGFILILVTQRPDKLDGMVVSECENRALLKVGSASVLEVTKHMLGLEDVPAKLLEKTLEFETGRALLYGRWAPTGPLPCYSAARRTKEGGRNLRSEHWATPA